MSLSVPFSALTLSVELQEGHYPVTLKSVPLVPRGSLFQANVYLENS